MTVRGSRRLRGGADDELNQGSTDLIASMAKGLAQVQTEASAQSDILGMLNQISHQLSQLQEKNQSMQHRHTQSNRNSQEEPDSGATMQNSAIPEQENGNLNNQGSDGSQSDPSAELQRLVSQLLQTNQQSVSQESSDNSSFNQGKQQPTAVKTAAQALSEAQYELSVELENSLNKLRQVINESEKLAEKIGNLLGEESNTPRQ